MPKGIGNKRYTPEFKTQVVETMQTGSASTSPRGRHCHEFVMNGGRIREAGSHGQLMELNGWYAHAIQEQKKAQNWTVGNSGRRV